jgi:hypothetical protein
LESDGTLSDKEILNIYKVENKQLKLKILKVEDDNRTLQKKCCDYNDLCYLNEKLNKKIEENHKQILSLKSKCEQKDEVIKENEKKIKELNLIKDEFLKIKNNKIKYEAMEEELLNLKKILNDSKVKINKEDVKDENIQKNINTYLNEFNKEMKAFLVYDKTKNNLIENIIRKEFDEHSNNIQKIFEENSFSNSKPYKTIEYLNNKMEELYGYKTRAEKYQGQVELLLNEQKLLKDQINVYRKISEESVKMKEIQKEKIDKLKLEQNMNKDILNRVRKYIQRHFSMDTQQELLKLIEKY